MSSARARECDIVGEETAYAIANGLVMLSRQTCDTGERHLSHAPFTLLPSPIPARCFERAVALAEPFGLLVHRVASDHAFLRDTLRWYTIDLERSRQRRSILELESDSLIETGV